MIEFYDADALVAMVESSIVPPVGSLVSIRKATWKVVDVTYAVDYVDGPVGGRKLIAAVRIVKEGK